MPSQRWFLGLVLAMSLWTTGTPAEDLAPEATIEALHAILLQVMQGGGDFGDRVAALDPVLERAYNFPLMARVAVGRSWGDLADDPRLRVIDAFRRNSVATYASRFVGFHGETFTVLGTRSTDAGDVVVASQIVPGDGDPVAIDYLLRRGDGGWRIVDVYVAGTISELATKRSEFAALIGQGGIDGLIAALDAKSAALAGP